MKLKDNVFWSRGKKLCERNECLTGRKYNKINRIKRRALHICKRSDGIRHCFYIYRRAKNKALYSYDL